MELKQFEDSNIFHQLRSIIRTLGVSSVTKFDWSDIGLSLWEPIDPNVPNLSDEKVTIPGKTKIYVYELVAKCGRYTTYTGIIEQRVIGLNSGQWINGTGPFSSSGFLPSTLLD